MNKLYHHKDAHLEIEAVPVGKATRIAVYVDGKQRHSETLRTVETRSIHARGVELLKEYKQQ